MLLSELAQTSLKVASTRSRLAKIDALAECLKRLQPEEVPIGVAYLGGEIRQARLGIGYATVSSARTSAATEPALGLRDVDAALEALSQTSGAGSASQRQSQLQGLFGRATAEEQGFLQRLLLGELRQGALEGVMLEAVARAAGIQASLLRRAAMRAGSVRAVSQAALAQGPEGLAGYALTVFQPVQPMLAQPADDPAQALDQLGTAAFEWKIDGARVQVHRQGDAVRVFTRSLKEVTASVPEVIDAALALPVTQIILDGEAIALRKDGSPLPFQETMRRFGRKLEVETQRKALPLNVFFFDCLLLDGRDLTDEPLRARHEALCRVVPEKLRIERIISNAPVEADEFFARSLASGHEGVMAKALDSPYEAGGRGGAWLKIKQAHTLDLVVLAVEWGSGRRSKWLSNLHLGARDADNGGFVMLGKTFKGLTDAMLEWQTQRLLALETSREGHVVHVRPELVVEIAWNDLQVSTRYPGGLALRFARVKRYREDKPASEADTIATVRALHERATTRP